MRRFAGFAGAVGERGLDRGSEGGVGRVAALGQVPPTPPGGDDLHVDRHRIADLAFDQELPHLHQWREEEVAAQPLPLGEIEGGVHRDRNP